MPETVGRAMIAAIEVVAHMPRCRDCRWWEVSGRREIQPLGCCVLTQTGAGAYENPRANSSLALAVIGRDESAYWPYLRTSPDFGCVQWQAKSERADERG